MNRITLNNNIQMPMLGFGTFLMGGSECEESVLAAIRCGYRMIDTAQAYGNEEAVGNAIVKSDVPREELFLVTKVNFRSYENTRETVEASLNKLKTSYRCILEREIKPSEIRKLFDCWQKWFHGIALLRTATWVRGNVGNYTF